MRRTVYLDNHSTTPMDPRVFRAMKPYFQEKFGNAASLTHFFGAEAEKAVEKARGEIASFIGAQSKEIIFTSGATESNNLAIKGIAEAYREKGNHIITTAIEHKSVLDPCKRLALSGFKITSLGVDRQGRIHLNDLKKAIQKKTILISVQIANNEIGVIQPVAEIGKIAAARGILFHADAAQALGKIPIDVRRMGIDLLSLSAHKNYGAKGIGALFLRKAVKMFPQMDGGGHEGGFRSGTLNVPGIVGFGEACRLSRKIMKMETQRISQLRDRLQKNILNKIPDAMVNGSLKNRLPNNLNLTFPGINAKDLIARLKGVAVSSGSACTATSIEPSYVLKALGIPETLRHSSIRFGLGRFTTSRDVDAAAQEIVRAIQV